MNSHQWGRLWVHMRSALGLTGDSTALFPLDGGRRLGADVVDDAVYAADFVDDAVAHRRQRVEGDSGPVGGHEIAALHRPDRDDAVVAPRVAHHADRADRQEDGENLGGLSVEIRGDEL